MIQTLERRRLFSAATMSGSVNLAPNTSGNFFLPDVRVYIDANNNGVFDPGELSTTTDASGNYTLNGLPAGPCIVRQVLPADYKQISPSRGFGIHLTVEPGINLVNEDFQDKSVDGSISGAIESAAFPPLVNVTVYADLNNNGKLDGDEPRTLTDTVGDYTLSVLPPGEYIIRQIVPPGYAQVSPAHGFGIHTSSGGFNVVHNALFSDIVIGDPGGSISGGVFNANNAGNRTGRVILLPGWTAYLDLNNSGVLLAADPTCSTARSGGPFFIFTGLAPGSYIVRIVPQTGWTQATPAKDFGWHITLSIDQNVMNVLFSEMMTL